MTSRALDRIETTRLLCERPQPKDSHDLMHLLLHPEVMRWLSPTGYVLTERDLNESFAKKIDHWERYGFRLWLLRDRATGEMVGRGGLQRTYVAGLNRVEAGWAITPERWGQDLATELALASAEVAFNDLQLLEMVAFTLPHNPASRRVMEKARFRFARDIVHVGLPHVLYRRARRAEFRRSRWYSQPRRPL